MGLHSGNRAGARVVSSIRSELEWLFVTDIQGRKDGVTEEAFSLEDYLVS